VSVQVLVTRDFEQMSLVASEIVLERIASTLEARSGCVLGLATGRTPTGMYRHLAAAANAGAFDPARIRTFNLDEYIGLPGETAQDRTLHPESYGFFMVREFFGRLVRPFAGTSLPGGPLIDAAALTRALRRNPREWRETGTDAGRSIAIRPGAKDPVLRFVRDGVLRSYDRRIRAAGGIDLQVLGVGGRGHVAFHEAGIPFAGSRMLLVRLDEDTRRNAVADGHFESLDACPRYAVTMGAQLAYSARTVLLMASGARKTEPVARSLLEAPSPAVPISYGQRYADRGGELVYVLDRVAAGGLLARREALLARGVVIRELDGDAVGRSRTSGAAAPSGA
jgi:glucosamine-6-phosphate deaminase